MIWYFIAGWIVFGSLAAVVMARMMK